MVLVQEPEQVVPAQEQELAVWELARALVELGREQRPVTQECKQELSQAASTRTTYINRVRHGKMAASTNVPALTVTLTLTSALLCA